jgi:hypothetical protein
MRFTGLLAAVAVVAGCGVLPSVPPDWVVNRNPLPSCGEERLDQGGARDVAARTCLLEAFQEGRAAELISTGPTVEGDPITRYIRVHENGVVELFIDASRDRFGSGRWERVRCEALVPVEQVNDPPDLFFPAEEVFVEDGCAPEPVP